MPTRHMDWLRQAKRDLEQARQSLGSGYFEWACFAAQQGAEKAVKAVYQKLGAEAWGHSVADLLLRLPKGHKAPRSLIGKARELDKHYVSARYPNLHPVGAPAELYTKVEARRAIEDADAIIAFCEDNLL